jgi:phosphatidate cytidylyltransferase
MLPLIERLAAWPASQQVALLFVGLFGTLVLATAVAIVGTLRERGTLAATRWRGYRRELRAAWLGAAVFWAAWISGPAGASLLFAAISFLALREFITLQHTRRGDHRSLLLAFFVVLPAQYVIAGARGFDLFSVFVPVYVFLAIPVVSALAGDPERFLERNAKIQWGIMVCVYGLSHAPALLLLGARGQAGRGAFLVFFLVIVVAVAALAQAGVARFLRRRPVARAISRSFSWRGLFIGAAAGTLAGAALSWITPFAVWQAMALAAAAALAGLFGAFVMKALKKDAGVRSWGSAAGITGAVGLLDRIAPLAFAAPVFFHGARWYAGVPMG